MTSTLSRNKNGGLRLTVRYNQGADDWDQAIAEALQQHGITERDCSLIECIPQGLKLTRRKTQEAV